MRRSNKLLLISWAVFLIVLVGTLPANAQSRSLRWQRYDVDITNIQTSANKFDVTETYELVVESGNFGGGDVTIPTDRLTGLTINSITDGGQPLRQRSSESATPGTFYYTQSDGNLNLTYDFINRATAGQTRNIVLKYTVTGALRSYEGGDQLYWVAIPADKPISVMASKVTVTLPNGLTPDVYTSYPDTWPVEPSGNSLIWTSPSVIGADDSLEVRVQYKHDPAMAAPPWQATFDFQRNYEEKIQPLVNLAMAALGVLVAIGGTILVYIEYAKRKDPDVGPVPEYLSEPPSSEPPAVVHALLTEQVEVRDIIATLVDLARRGFVVFEQNRTEGLLSIFGGTEFTFHRTGVDESALAGFEKMLMQAFFGARQETSLTQLRNKFYQYIPNIQRAIYAALVSEGFYKQSPEATRGQWQMGGIALMALGGIGGFFAESTAALVSISPLLGVPLFALAFVGFVTLIAGSAMPRRTDKGALERAKWLAFKTYLSNIKQYTDVAQATDQFEKYIGYAVAFGIDRQWTHEFSNVLTSYPTWYYPTYLGGNWGRGYRYGGYGQPGFGQPDFGAGVGNVGNIGGLNEMSQNLTQGLNSLSDGLTKMLNDASSAMTSRPSSSSSGGRGGSFSGGGSHGGGGSGGGSRGFH